MKKQHINLTEEDKKLIEKILSQPVQKLRVQKRAKALKMLDQGNSYKSVSLDLETSYPTVLKWAKKYRLTGLEFLEDKPRSGRPSIFDGIDRAKVTGLACTEPPTGYDRWSLRLLSDRLVSLEILPQISYSEVRRILKKTNFNLIEKDNGVSEV